MSKEFLTGNEAFAYAALEAGVRVCAGYPGTPSSEVIETIAKAQASGRATGVHVEWSTNEKAALELLAGAAYAGARTLFTCKQVGLNVASDALMSLNYVGVKGGTVIFVADDPGPISSQTEQDTRRFASFSKVPVFDPATPEQGYAMMKAAFELSERYQTPVIMRPTTRICHASTFFDVPDHTVARSAEGFVKDSRWVIFPKRSYAAHGEINERLVQIARDVSGGAYDEFHPICQKPSATYGIVAGGISYAYVREALRLLESYAEQGMLRVAPAFDQGLSHEFSGASAQNVPCEPSRVSTRSISCEPSEASAQDLSCAPSEVLTQGTESAATSLQSLPAYKVLQVGVPYPFPADRVATFTQGLEHVIVFEELDHVLEDEMLKLAGRLHAFYDVSGKLTGATTTRGENTIDDIAHQLCDFFGLTVVHDVIGVGGIAAHAAVDAEAETTADAEAEVNAGTEPEVEVGTSVEVGVGTGDGAGTGSSIAASVEPPARPPLLCPGCPHRGAFYAVKAALRRPSEGIFCGDIGCYTLGNAKPLNAVDTCLCMGAGITIAQGLSVVEPDKKAIAFVGDSTFFASGMTGIANAVYNQHDITVVVLDNATTAMTGSQPHPGTGVTLMGPVSKPLVIEEVLRALGVQVITRANPLVLGEAVAAAQEALEYAGPSAVIYEAPCIKLIKPDQPIEVDKDRCTGCARCVLKLGCPALSWDAEKRRPVVDVSLCNGCGLCTDVCNDQALVCKSRQSRCTSGKDAGTAAQEVHHD